MQDREEPSQRIFTVKGCGMAEFNGKYFVDTGHENGFMNGKRCYRRDGVGDAGSECTIYHNGMGWWLMCENYSMFKVYYYVQSDADQPPTSGWDVGIHGSGSPPRLVYEGNDVPNFYLLLYG